MVMIFFPLYISSYPEEDPQEEQDLFSSSFSEASDVSQPLPHTSFSSSFSTACSSPFFFFPSFSQEKIPPKEILGGKGKGLCDMGQLGLPVPPGFVIPLSFFQQDRPLYSLEKLQKPLKEAIKHLELLTSCSFLQETQEGHQGKENSLFLSVRSGGAVSMPGMMDTFLNVGLLGEKKKEHLRQRLHFEPQNESYEHLLRNIETMNNQLRENALSLGFGPEFFQNLHQEENLSLEEAWNHPLYLLSCAVLSVWLSAHKKRAKDYLNLSPSYGDIKTFQVQVMNQNSFEPQGYDNLLLEESFPGDTSPLSQELLSPQSPHNMCENLSSWKKNKENKPYDFEENSLYKNCHFFSWNQKHIDSPSSSLKPSTFQSAVVIQAMVFSNGQPTNNNHSVHNYDNYRSRQDDEEKILPPYLKKGFFCGKGLYGSGVLFTRNPTTGEDVLFGEFLPYFQGDSLVSGERTPLELHEWLQSYPFLKDFFLHVKDLVEKQYTFPQDMEFSIEDGFLFFLQTRHGKMSLNALGCVLESYVLRGLITLEEAYKQLSSGDLNTVDVSYLHNKHDMKVLASGQDLGSGAVSGPLLLDLYDEEYLKHKSLKDHVVFVPFIHPDHIPLLLQAKGVLCAQGGITSHGALILRSMGKVCALNIPCTPSYGESGKKISSLHIGSQEFFQGDILTLENGVLYEGKPLIRRHGGIGPSLDFFLKTASKQRQSHIFVNADSPEDIERGLLHGAKGVGLVRSEHMMLFPHILPLFRSLILQRYEKKDPATFEDKRQEFLDLHSQDIAKLLVAAKDLPVTFRLLDPPLHEFFPQHPSEREKMAQDLNYSYEKVVKILEDLQEYNPMMALRGVRLGLTFPDFYRDQCLALEKALHLSSYAGQLKVMIPFVNHPLDIIRLKELIPELKKFSLGIMIETPRACLLSWVLVKNLDFVSFGTNDLTQGTWCLSRDDQKSLEGYWSSLRAHVEPFRFFDRRGVGALMAIACAQLKQHYPHISLSVCGDHAGHWEHRDFFESLGITILSCSPRRVLPMALGLTQ